MSAINRLIPEDLKETYEQCFDYDHHALMDKPFIRGLIERIGRAEDRIAEARKALDHYETVVDAGHDSSFSMERALSSVRAALAAPSGVKPKEKL